MRVGEPEQRIVRPGRPTRARRCANGDTILVQRDGCLRRGDMRSKYRRERPAPILARVRACKTRQEAFALILAEAKRIGASRGTRRKWERAADRLPALVTS